MDKQKIAAYLNGTCTKAEKLQMEQWLEEDPAHVRLLESMMPAANVRVNKDAVRKRVMNTIGQDAATKTLSKTLHLFPVWKIAAAILLVLACSFVLYLMNTAQPVYESTTTAYGQRREISLHDSSHVTLNGSSKVEVPVRFASDRREVLLEGEAFFQVKRDAQRPFIIHSGDVTVEVLGTSFNVRSYNSETDIIVTVATGKVSVSYDEKNDHIPRKVILTPGQQVIINKVTHHAETQSVNAEQFTAWKDGYLRFRNVSLGEIFRSLERIYKITIHADDALDVDQRLTLNQREGSREDTFKILAAMADFEYTFRNDSLVVVKNGKEAKENNWVREE